MNTKRSLPLLAGLLLLAAILLVIIRYLSENEDKPQVTTAPPVPSRSRPAQAISDEPGKHPEEQPGVIDLPEFGRIPYARHRTVRVAELMKYLHDDDAFETYMKFCPNVTMDVYEDDKGYLVFLAHNRGRFLSQPRDAEAIKIMANWGQVISPQIKPTFRMDDDEFVTILLKHIKTQLTFEAYGDYPERETELILWPVTVEYDEKYTGKEEKNFKFPAIMIRYSSGVTPRDYHYEENIPREETYLRVWDVRRYEKSAANKEVSGLISAAGASLIERRLDLEK